MTALLNEIGGLRAEYNADIGLNVLEYNWDRIAPAKRLAALTAIFNSAPQMLFKADEIYAASQPMGLAANDALLLNEQNIDTLDVQTRAVRILLVEMPGKASDFFAQIALPNRRAACADPAVDDLGSYYGTLALLMRDDRVQTIGGQPKALFFLSVVRGANDLERLAPLVSIMDKVKLGDGDLRIAAGYLASNMQSADASDREEAALSGSLLAGMPQLVSRMRAAQIPTAQLLTALRASLTTNLSRSYCSDASTRRNNVALKFNALLAPASPDLPKEIDVAELRAVTPAGSAADATLQNTSSLWPEFRRIVYANEARQAANNDPGTAGTIEPDSSDVEELLEFALSPVDADADCALCELVARGEMFGNLQNFLPAGRMLESWINGEVDFLTASPLEDEDPPTYMLILKTLILFSRPVSPQAHRFLVEQAAKGILPQYPLEEPEFVHKQLRAAADPVIKAYMEYEDLFHPDFVPLGMKSSQGRAARSSGSD